MSNADLFEPVVDDSLFEPVEGDSQFEPVEPGQFERVGKNTASGALGVVADSLAAPSFRDVGRGALSRFLGIEPAPTVQESPGYALKLAQYAQGLEVPAREGAGTIERFATTTLPRAVGSMGAFVALGALTRKLSGPAARNAASASGLKGVPGDMPAGMAIGIVGAQAGAGNAYLEALDAGAPEDVALTHALVGAGLGYTEAFPIAKWLAGTGAGGALRRALREGTEEALQEWGQAVGQNISAQQLFDPERPWLKGVDEGAAAGATLGTVGSLLFSWARRGRRYAEKPKPEATPADDLNFALLEGESAPITGVAEAVAAANAQPGTPTTPPVPEGRDAILEQLRLAGDEKSTRAAVLVTPGSYTPDIGETSQLASVPTPHGLVFFNPAKTTAEAVQKAASGPVFDTSILGMSGQPVAAADTAVTTSTPAARNVAAELTTPEGVAAAVAAQQASVPGGLTEVKPAETVIAERVANAAKEPPIPARFVTATDLPDARAAAATKWYHGTGEANLSATSLDTIGFSEPGGLVGMGFYLTDDPVVGESYAKVRGKKGTPTVYQVGVAPRSVVNYELPLPADVADLYRKRAALYDKTFDSGAAEAVETAIAAGKSGMDVHRALTDALSGVVPKSEVYEDFQAFQSDMRALGYDALTHVGGTRAGKGKHLHKVLVLFDPSDVSYGGRFPNTVTGLARVEDAQKGGEPRGQEEVQGQAPGQGMTAQQPGLSSEDVVRLSSFLPITPEDDARYMQAVNTGDMETAQRMVDEAAKRAGYSVGPVWHGTSDTKFTVFRTRRGTAEQAAWFTPIENLARYFSDLSQQAKYGGNYGWREKGQLLRVFLRTQNPLVVDAGGRDIDLSAERNKVRVKIARQGKYDALIIKNAAEEYDTGDQYAIFSPSQIKSADPVTRDASGIVIPLSQRFNPTSPDIRYSAIVPGVPGEEATPVASDPQLQRFRGAMRKEGTFGRAPYVTGETRERVRNTTYAPVTEKEALARAQGFIEAEGGPEKAIGLLLNKQSGLELDDRFVLQVAIERALSRAERTARAAGNVAEAQRLAEVTASMVDATANELSTSPARLLRWHQLRLYSPAAEVADYRRSLMGARKTDQNDLDGHINTAMAEAQAAPTDAMDDLVGDRQTQDVVRQAVDEALEADAAVQQAAASLGVKVRDRIAKFRKWLAKAWNNLWMASFAPGGAPRQTRLSPYDEASTDDVLDRVLKRRMREIRVGIARVLRLRLTDQAVTREQLAEHLARATGLPPARAQVLANRLRSRFETLLAARRARIVARATAQAPKRRYRRKEAWETLVAKVNEGTLDKQAVWDQIAGKLGLPAYDANVAAEIVRLTNDIQDTPEGSSKRQRAIQALYDYKAKQVGPTFGDTAWAVWYARLLSGPPTHILNVSANVVQSGAAWLAATGVDPVRGKFLAANYARGVREGAPAVAEALTTGRTTGPRLLKVEAARPLELGETLPLNPREWRAHLRRRGPIGTFGDIMRHWRIVSRAMTAEDMPFFLGLREMRAAQLALAEARAQGLRGDAAIKEAEEILGTSDARMTWAREQAALEGLTGVEQERRAVEIRDFNRPPATQEDMIDYALRNTFNNPKPYGVAGIFAGMIDYATQKAPLLHIQFPFTRVLANAGNEVLEYVGWWRTVGTAIGKLAGKQLKAHGRPARPGEISERIAKQTFGLFATYALVELLTRELAKPPEERKWDIHGPGPSDTGHRRQLGETMNWKPYRLVYNGQQYNLNELPLGGILAFVGTMMDARRYGELKNTSVASRLSFIANALMSAVTERGSLAQIRDITELLIERGPSSDQALIRALTRPIGGLVSSGFTKFISRLYDSTRMDTGDWDTALLAQVPFAQVWGKPDLNRWGQPIKADPMDRFVTALTPTPLDQFLYDRGLWVSDPSPKQLGAKEGVPYSNAERYKFIQLSGPAIFDELTKNLPQMRKQTPEWNKEFIERVSKKHNDRAKAVILAERQHQP